MENPNALIAMAFVSENANNPYSVFCEYIKYCLFASSDDEMSIAEIRQAVSREFGLSLPHYIAIQCLSIIEDEGIVRQSDHKIKKIGHFDTESFDNERNAYRQIEDRIINDLITFVQTYGKNWTYDYAREQLIKVLDQNGIAYDIFIYGKPKDNCLSHESITLEEIDRKIPDEDAIDGENEEKQPLYSDSLYVGKFIEGVLASETLQREYLKKICEGLMVCVGAYQLPSTENGMVVPQIRNTEFFFDTRLLLRFVGCAGEAAVEAARELVSMIQLKGGRVCYYPQTLEEMERAFDDAILCLRSRYPLKDNEMRVFSARNNYNITILQSKKRSLRDELSQSSIYMREHETFGDNDRIQFGFDRNDFVLYMSKQLTWDSRTIENDAYSIWETHMRRRGRYTEYCGTQEHLPVFVTTNSRLVVMTLAYREARPEIKEIYGWRPNRLPVITDVKLTCRLWSPAENSKRLALLYLTASAFAAQRPTKRYLEKMRTLAIELGNSVPEYAGIPLPSYFDDNVTDAFLEKTRGSEEKFNIGTLASSLAELAEWKAKEQEDITNVVKAERDQLTTKLDMQTQSIIYDAVAENKKKLGLSGILLFLIAKWKIVLSLLFAIITTLVSAVTEEWSIMWILIIEMALLIAQEITGSKFIERFILNKVLPPVDDLYQKRIHKLLRTTEVPYEDTIIQKIRQENNSWNLIEKMKEECSD